MAQYDGKVGSTLLDLSLKEKAPISTLRFLVVTGVKINSCGTDGMPEKDEFPNLNQVVDSLDALINRIVSGKNAGTFTYQCQRLNYYYVSDTTGIREKLLNFYSSRFRQYQPYMKIREDKNWEVYLNFLYPNEVSFEFMLNQKVLMKLEEAGDKLEEERLVDHWIYFKSTEDIKCFRSYLYSNNFKIVDQEKIDSTELPFKLHISRIDKVDINSISNTTLQLRKEAKKCSGDYDGWETQVPK